MLVLAQIIDDDRLLRGYGHLSDGALRDGSTAGAGNSSTRYPICGSEMAGDSVLRSYRLILSRLYLGMFLSISIARALKSL